MLGNLIVFLMSFYAFAYVTPRTETEQIKDKLDRQSIRVFLNGTNINSVTNQVLKNVDVEIGNDGMIKIIGPQYEVTQEKNYTRLIPTQRPAFEKEKKPPPFEVMKESKDEPIPKLPETGPVSVVPVVPN